MPWDEQEAAFQGSDREFLLWLYQEFSRLMFYTAQKYLADPHSQEEVVQESLKKLIEKVAVLRRLKRPALAGYVRATVRNTAIDLLKVQGRERERVVGLEDLSGGSGGPDPGRDAPDGQSGRDGVLPGGGPAAAGDLAPAGRGDPDAAGAQVHPGL